MPNGRRPYNENTPVQPGAEGRVPPQAVDVEAAVLAAMLLEKDAIAKALEVLQGDVFYKPAHQSIFDAMVGLFERSEPVDLITLTEELRRSGVLEKIGGEYYLTELSGRVSSAANIEYHAHIVLEKALMRQLISASTEVVTRAYNETEDALGLLDEAEQKIFDISEQRMKKSFVTMNTAVHKTMDMLQSIHGKHSGVTGVPAGFTDLDNLTGGFQNSDLIIVAGRPSQGKTAFVLSVARNASVLHNVPIGFFSLEMSAQQLVMRLMCAEARVDAHKVRTGRLPEDEWKKLSMSVGRLYKAKILIDDTPALSVLELRAKARRLKAEHNVGMIVVDYLQLMQGARNGRRLSKRANDLMNWRRTVSVGPLRCFPMMISARPSVGSPVSVSFSMPYISGRCTKMTTSASCSMAPDSRRSARAGFLSLRASTARFSCDSAMTGIFKSFARALSDREMPEISCSRL